MPFFKMLFLILFPGGLLFALGLYQQLRSVVPPSFEPLLALFPAIVAGVGLLLGWRFNRNRVVWAILLLIVVERSQVVLPPFGADFGLLAAMVLLPVNLMLLGWWTERGLFSPHGISRAVFYGIQAVLVYWIYEEYAGEVIARIVSPLIDLKGTLLLPVPQLPLCVFAFCLVALLLRAVLKPESLEVSFCWVLLAAGAGLWWPFDFAFWGGIAITIMAIAVIESSFTMAFNDELTGLPARRAMNEFLLKIGRRYTVAMVDVDHFKKVNDTHGHDVGDQVLQMVSKTLWQVGGGGRPFRYGGEEFAVIFPGKDVEQTIPHLEELRERISETGFTLRGKDRPKKKPKSPPKKSEIKQLRVTVSIGVATRDEKNASTDDVIKAADQALYKAKKGGRNKVCR